MMKRYARAMMSVQQQKKRNSILLLFCVSFFHAMNDTSSERVTFTQETHAVRGARFVRDMRERISNAEGSRREWLENLLARYEQTCGKTQVIVPRPVIPARPRSPLRISGVLAQDTPNMQLVPSARSAFVSYHDLAKKGSAPSK